MTALRASWPDVDAIDARLRTIAHAAVASLHAELVLSPKPGLVCPADNGSHDDMDAATMMRSLLALRHAFRDLADGGAAGVRFAGLEAIGIRAERSMLRATGGVNTHRGALFTIGLLAAAAGSCAASGPTITPSRMRRVLRERWGRALTLRSVGEATHGREMAVRHGVGGARREAADGFPTVFDVVLPALHDARRAGHDERKVRLHALMTSIASVGDTNLLYRGGDAGLARAQSAARAFIASGGVARGDCDAALHAIGRDFVAHRLSPGGSADLLAAALFVDRVATAG